MGHTTPPTSTASSSAVAALGTIAAIWAHPDDETYLAAGIMAAAVANGQRVVCVSATAGELGTNNAETWPPERLGRVRKWEAAASMAILGVNDHRWLGLPDGGLAGLDDEGPVAQITSILAEVRPDTILTFGPDGGTFHPDHQTISRWVGLAWQRADRPGRILHSCTSEEFLAAWGAAYEAAGVYMSDERPVGVPRHAMALRLELSGVALDQKVAALAAMHTQTSPLITLAGLDAYASANNEECYIAALP